VSEDRNEASPSRAAEAAWREALRRIAVRPRTTVEIRQQLEERGHGAASIDRVVDRLRERGYVDDAELAWNFIVARAPRLGHGPRRLIGDLVRRGVSRETAEAAWRRAVEQGDVDGEALLRRELQRRLGPTIRPVDPRTRRRVYNALLRAGFEGSAVHRELALLGGAGRQGFDDDFA
jgi:regulatory protein